MPQQQRVACGEKSIVNYKCYLLASIRLEQEQLCTDLNKRFIHRPKPEEEEFCLDVDKSLSKFEMRRDCQSGHEVRYLKELFAEKLKLSRK